ncbi:DUF1294 domain-containing protein [Flavobacterium sp. GSA192]|uniref:DUF1294 domain-containing protein n=1 Tax=Flavobacterium sp. GSA192 TaxID=2576304 RepID=UPI001129E16B|nr:DUF1294 domain-containing protein [Flavobacterium sp. GSA192]
MTSLFYFFLILNVIAFLVTGYDKQLAIQQKRRISERTLLSFVFIGGTVGSGLAMLLFRHKTNKIGYLWKFWFIIFIQIILIYLGYHFKILTNKI